MTGVPFEALESLGTPEVAAAARAVLAAEQELDDAAFAARAMARGLDDAVAKPIRKAVKKERPVSAEQRLAYPELERYARGLEQRQSARAQLASPRPDRRAPPGDGRAGGAG